MWQSFVQQFQFIFLCIFQLIIFYPFNFLFTFFSLHLLYIFLLKYLKNYLSWTLNYLLITFAASNILIHFLYFFLCIEIFSISFFILYFFTRHATNIFYFYFSCTFINSFDFYVKKNKYSTALSRLKGLRFSAQLNNFSNYCAYENKNIGTIVLRINSRSLRSINLCLLLGERCLTQFPV